MVEKSFAGAFAALFLIVMTPLVRGEEEKIPLDQVPKAAMDAVKARFPKATAKGAEKEEEDGKTIYEVSLVDGGKTIDVAISPAGKILEIEKEIAAEDLPKPVATAIKAKYAGATVKKAEEITEGDETEYEVLLTLADGKTVEVKLDAKGKVIEDEDDEDDDDKD